MNFNRIDKLCNYVSSSSKRKPTVLLDPNQTYRMFGTADDVNIAIDDDEWVIPEKLQPFINEIIEKDASVEEKILDAYVKICEEYTYDDNVLSYLKKNDNDTFYLPDTYGRNPMPGWKEKREEHNRRNCFEVSRILAKSINEIIKKSGQTFNYDTCIIWDEAVTHYLVGLSCDDYCACLDLDDFNQIKDLTRVKTGLTLEGIKVYGDSKKKFESVIQNFNEGKNILAKEQMKEKIKNDELNSTDGEQEVNASQIISDDMKFIQYTLQVLKDEYDIDSAGIFEYLKEVVDMKIGPKARRKIWTKVQTEEGIGDRFTRCLEVYLEDIPYIIDVTQKDAKDMFTSAKPEEFDGPNAKYIRFNDMQREWENDPYDGR